MFEVVLVVSKGDHKDQSPTENILSTELVTLRCRFDTSADLVDFRVRRPNRESIYELISAGL